MEVFGSNLGRETGYSDRFPWVYSVPLRKCWDWTSMRTQPLSSMLFPVHHLSLIWRYIFSILKASLSNPQKELKTKLASSRILRNICVGLKLISIFHAVCTGHSKVKWRAIISHKVFELVILMLEQYSKHCNFLQSQLRIIERYTKHTSVPFTVAVDKHEHSLGEVEILHNRREKDYIFLVFNYLSATPWRWMKEWGVAPLFSLQ